MQTAPLSRWSELWASKQLLKNLTVRELKVRYKRSVLGFLWSLLNPLLMMAVFTLIFSLAFRAPIPDFPIFFLVGYLPWSFFQASVQVSTGVIVGNANLVTKVYFPREVLPMAVVLSQAVHFGLAMIVLFIALLVKGYNFLPYLPGMLLATLLLFLFTTGVSMFFAAANTKLRDIQEFLNVLFLTWFYLTPVIYSLEQIPERFRWVIQLNPMTHVVEMMRDSLYRGTLPSSRRLAAGAISALVALLIGFTVFRRFADDFAKEV